MRYCVKNCPTIFFKEIDGRAMGNDLKNGATECKDCDDCPLKQIVQTCKTQIKFCQNCTKNEKIGTYCENCIESGETSFARRILDKLEIEEANE